MFLSISALSLACSIYYLKFCVCVCLEDALTGKGGWKSELNPWLDMVGGEKCLQMSSDLSPLPPTFTHIHKYTYAYRHVYRQTKQTPYAHTYTSIYMHAGVYTDTQNNFYDSLIILL